MKARKMDWFTGVLVLGLVGIIVFDILIVMRGSLEAFHSDSATAILLAREQMLTGQIIPDGWYYANDIWMLSLNLFCIPFMLFLKNWMLCRQLAVILQLFVVTALLIHYVRKVANVRWALVSAILFWCPLSVTVREHFLYQATYATGMFQTLLVLIAAHGFFQSTQRKTLLFHGVILSVLTIVMTAAGIRFVGATVLPIVGALGLLLLFDMDFDLTLFREKTYGIPLLKLIWVLMMSVFGYWIHLKIRAGGAISEFGMVFIDAGNLLNKISELLQSYMSIWGCLDASEVLSVQGIIAFCGFVLCIVMNVVVPVYLFVRFRYIEKRESRFFILYSVLSWVVLCYLVTFTNMYNPYYLLPVFFNGCILSAIALADLYQMKMNLSICLAVLCIIPFTLVTGLYWSSRDYGKCEKDYAFLEILKENELYFGCTGIFWDAYRFTVLSDGEVEIVSYEGQPETPQLWLSSEKWYQSEYYEGKSFILVRNGWQDISEEWKQLAEDMIPYGEFSIYVYSENVYKMIEE